MGSVSNEFDLLVIGAGPAGYVGAIRAAQLGMNVALIERDQLGGVCLNWGCIPSKALLAAAEHYQWLSKEAAAWGIHAQNISHDWQTVIGRARQVAGNLNRGVAALLKKKKVRHIQGSATVVSPNQVRVLQESNADSDPLLLKAGRIMIATGAKPRSLPLAPFDGRRVVSYKQAMALAQQPERLVVIGAGAIGMEFAYFFNAFGTQVTIVEMLDRLLPNEDLDSSKALARSFRRQHIQTHVSSKLTQVDETADGLKLTIAAADDDQATQTLEADVLLVAVGVEAVFEGLFDSSLGLETHSGRIEVDRATYQTSVAGIFAVGDVIGPPWLAHVASEEAVNCVERMAGRTPRPIDYEAIPAATYCVPQIASLGQTEQQLIQQGMTEGNDYLVGRFPLQASGKAQALGHTQGFVKLICQSDSRRILGVHMVGHQVTDLLAELGLAHRMGATIDDIVDTMHAHPTLSEAVHEAAMDAVGRMVHF